MKTLGLVLSSLLLVAGPLVAQQPISGGTAAPYAEPRWPQKFDLGLGERHGYEFSVGQPGRIAVTVQWQGVPLIVTLVKPGGGVVEKQGVGSASIEYKAIDEDVRKGVLWRVSLRAAQEQKPVGAQGVGPVKVELKSVATGNVSVLHPPADLQRAQAEVTARAQAANARHQAMVKQRPVVSGPEAAAQWQVALNKTVALRHTALLDQLKGKIPADVHQKVTQQIALRAQGKPMALDGPLAVKGGAALKPPVVGGGPTVVSATRSASTGAKPVGSTQPANVVASPVIGALSVAQGDPGTPVMITGSGFLEVPGEVHFIIANGADLVAPITIWSGGQVLTEVPTYKNGVPAYNGYVYLKSSNGAKTGMQPFRFIPVMETAVLGFPPGSSSGAYNQLAHLYDSHAPDLDWGTMIHTTYLLPWGLKGDDEFYLQTRLKNGWTVESAMPISDGHPGPYTSGSAGAYITEARFGTDSPYIKMHWWLDANSYVSYHLQIVIKGPKGLPYQ
jgi:hypothetical protein